MLQLQLIRSKSDSRCLFVPTSIDSLVVFPEEMKNSMSETIHFDRLTQQESSVPNVYQNQEAGILYTAGVLGRAPRESEQPSA